MRWLAVAVAVLACGCAARVPWNTGDKVALGAMVACQAFDSATTVYGVEHEGMHEANPMMPNESWANVVVKAAVSAGLAAIAHAMPGHDGRRAVLGIGAAAGCVPGAINVGKY